MRVDDFLGQFARIPDRKLHTLRRSKQLDKWPSDEAFFLALTKELFPGRWQDWARRQRFVSILGEFLYRDGRTFTALMHIADVAHDVPDVHDSDGINALARIWCYLNTDRAVPITDEGLVSWLERLRAVPALSHNATQCRNLILRRRPDLARP